MLLNNIMEGETNKFISSIKFYDERKENANVKSLRNFILPEAKNMAIKQNQSDNSKCVYSIPVIPPASPMNDRMKSIHEAKQAFLNSTVTVPQVPPHMKREEPTLHYAQIVVTTESDDTRSTGGGKTVVDKQNNCKTEGKVQKLLNISPSIQRVMDMQQRKVSFKVRNATTAYKRPPIISKTTMTITKNNVSELTKKFDNLISEPHNILSKSRSKIVGSPISRYSHSNSSTPSSTLSSSPNIKIVLRQRRGSKKRSRKRCSSMDSIDKYVTANPLPNICIIRSKSDGTRAPKSPKKRVKPQNESKETQNKSFDCVDGISQKTTETEPPKDKTVPPSSAVKSYIKKFECEIIAQSNLNNTIKKQMNETKKIATLTEKPKVPEKKSTLVLTKNIVVKDGVPRIKTIKQFPGNPTSNHNTNLGSNSETQQKLILHDRNKYKTNYIHSDKLPLHIVEIVQEDETDITESTKQTTTNPKTIEEEDKNKICQDARPPIEPNESFLWRRKSSTQIYSDNDNSTVYSVNSSTISEPATNEVEGAQAIINAESHFSSVIESQDANNSNIVKSDPNLDFESNLVEAYNKEVLVGFTTKPKNITVIENEYETLEPKEGPENIVIIPVNTINRSSKINCPLPDIPKEQAESPKSENIYQCLLEMRSHPEGDESSIHSYELYDSQLEERTRGDGDSDDGYEYCKSPIKPYCLTSSSGIQIAENYQPPSPTVTLKNYTISKSVSGTSTVSYEKIGSERIYEKIPARRPKSKDSSPSYSGRHSVISSEYNENIYDSIKHSDTTSLSNCYESIPNSPSMVKLRSLKKHLPSAVQKRLSFDRVSNVSQSTMSSEQKTNSIYGQRSVLSYNGQEIAFQVPSSETSASERSDRSDRSDDWVDVSDEEKNDEQQIIIVRERSRGRKSPISWSQKVRHQWQKSPKRRDNDQECESSDSGHLYESLEPALPARPSPPALPPALPYEDDFDSFDSDSDDDDHDKSVNHQCPPTLPASRLPSPPSGGPYTLTKIASAAQRKMRELKRNLTKRYSVAMDGKSFIKPPGHTNGTYDTNKSKTKSVYNNYEKPETERVYSNINFNDIKPVPVKTENPSKIYGSLKDELKTVIGDKRLSNGEITSPEKPQEKPTTPTSENNKKDNGTLSRKTYFSFKSRFRRATSLAVDINSEVPSALKITNSTFYLTDSMDGDSGFSNCSDNGAGGSGSSEAISRRGDGTRLRAGWAESSPCLALERPSVPPPPPPVLTPAQTDLSAVNEELKRLLPMLSRKEKGRTRTSWYAECGLGADIDCDADPSHNTNNSWYSESGVYQAGNASTSSGASSASHPASPLPHSLFTHEPLYQFYNAAKVESVCRETGDSDSETYEGGARPECSSPGGAATLRPSAMALVAPRGPARTLWCEVPEVVNSAVLSSLAPAQKRLQEAKFEILTSEASYLNSLNVLETHFISHPAFRETHILPRADFDALFSTILPVRKCSQLLMSELEKCWQEDILLGGVCGLVRRHAERHFHVYVRYCERQSSMVQTLQRLKERPTFAAALRRLESHPACQSLSLHSFLLLPMQRATRLPLLLDAVLRNLADGDQEYHECARALTALNNLVSECNEGARSTERIEEMYRLSRLIEFPAAMRDQPCLGPACGRRDRKPVRWLVRSGEITHLVWKSDELKLTFGKKFHKVPLHLFLFNDLLVITKKKSEECFIAVEHCARSLVEVCASEGGAASARHALLLTLLENHEGRTVEMLMSCENETELSRWLEALSAAGGGAGGAGGADGEAVYAGWDCPQVAALYAHAPAQPDELALAEGDVINVTRKTAEGWYYGERLRDGESGWFPGSYTVEIASQHVRARNLRQRYRLLALSGTYRGPAGKRKPL